MMVLFVISQALEYNVNEILMCNIAYRDPSEHSERRWCIISKHYEQMWLSCEFPDE
jgi:hypothetical protein